MEKRKKTTGIDAVNSYDADLIGATDDDVKKVRSMGSMTIFASFIGILVFLYVFYASYNHNINESISSLNKPSIRGESALLFNNVIQSPSTTFRPEQLSEDIEPALKAISEEERQNNVNRILEQIRLIKSAGRAIETDPEAKLLVSSVQDELRQLIPMRYGPGPYFLEMKLKFPETMPDFAKNGEDGTILIELGPIELVPYSIYYIMELARQWKGGAFHRRAGHVLQAMVNKAKNVRGLAFQEYHPDFPHRILTLGYAGRPGGPEFYISIMDNVENHGPASQGSATEADSCFGKIYQGEAVIERMKKQPGAIPPMGFLDSDKNYIRIPSLRVMTHDEIPQI